jgi:exopolyphosphatase/pppGpp-phosphohydrolase
VLAVPGSALVAGALPTGSARLTSALVRADPPTAAEITALRFEAARLVAATPAGRAEHGVMVGGTATNLVKLLVAEPPAIDLADVPVRLDRAALDTVYTIVSSTPADEIAARYLVNRRRAGMLAAGAALVEAFMHHHGLGEVSVSRASLREGAILARERGGDGWLAALPALCVGGR